MDNALPLGRSNFAALRTRDEIYVDKTALIHRLCRSDAKIFLTRPRRFGKSLLVSTFETLFKDGLRHFQGLAIERLWRDQTYPVVRLDFSEIKEFSTADEFKAKFDEKLAATLAPVGFQLDPKRFGLMVQLSLWFASLQPSSLVILIDEYDAPLTQCLDRPDLFEKVRSVLSEFHLILKSNEGCLRFFFMTGITKFSNTSIFSAFNNLQDISLDPLYGDLLGYTDQEIRTFFSPHLDRAAAALSMSREHLLEELKAKYAGFSFDEKAEHHVYCPWSVLNFLNRPDRGMQNYWYASGGQPVVLKKFLANHALSRPMAYSETKEIRLSELNAARQYDVIGLDALLAQAGYYTIKSVTPDGYAVLGYPNEEVAVSMAELSADELLAGRRIRRTGASPVCTAMTMGDVDEVLRYFNDAVDAIDYARYPIVNEASCRACLQGLLIGAALIPKVEIRNAGGRSDLEVEVDGKRWIFELKFARKTAEVSPLLDEAIEKIRACRYGGPRENDGSIRVAAVFDAASRQFTAWRTVALA